MAPKFALFIKGTKMPLNQGFQNRFLVTTVSRQALDISWTYVCDVMLPGSHELILGHVPFYKTQILLP